MTNLSKTRAIVILLVGVVFPFCLAVSASRSVNRPNVLGKWYYQGGTYYKDADRKDVARWYEFKGGSEVVFSSCTDHCGCLRMTTAGNYEWENDSIIAVSWTKEKYWRAETFEPLREVRQQRLKITEKGKGLFISRVRP